jgi:phospholipase/lecithinase/hemolysin
LAGALVLAGCGGGGGGGGGSSPGPVTSPPTSNPPPVVSPPPASPFAVANPFAISGATSVDQVRVDDLRVFGDSYSQEGFAGTKTWTMVLRDEGTAARTEVYAVGGASASLGASNNFARQLDTFDAANRTIGNRDLTAVYFGYNDLSRELTPARAGYEAGVDRLLAAGAADDDRRLFLTMLHDWSRNPGVTADRRARVNEFNSSIAGLANRNSNIIAVDLFTVFERVFERPGDFGLVDVTGVDPARSATDTLFFDPTHFGNRGQEIIASVYRHYLTRGWDWANSIAAGSGAAQRLSRDLDNGLLALGLDDEAPLGLTSLALGNGGVATPQGLVADPAGVSLDGPSRAAFAATYGGSPAAGGIALDYRLARDQRFGVAVSRYDSASDTDLSAARLSQDQTSDGVAVYWQQEHGGVQSTTQFAFLQHQFTERAQDDLLGNSGVTEHAGRTWSLDQKLARPTRASAGTVTPWVSLSYQSHDLAPYEAKSLYTSNVRYSGATATDVLGAIGIDLAHDPIDLGRGRNLWLSGKAAYVASVYRDDVQVTMSEAALPGFSQQETIQRERVERFDLSLDAVLGLSPDLNLRAAYALAADRADEVQSLRFSLDYRF